MDAKVLAPCPGKRVPQPCFARAPQSTGPLARVTATGTHGGAAFCATGFALARAPARIHRESSEPPAHGRHKEA